MTDRFEVRITAGASADLEALHDYVRSTRSPEEADSLLDQLIAKGESLQRFPRRGAVPQEAVGFSTGEIREALVGPYRLIYRIVRKVVYVVLIAHHRRDMRTLLQQRLLSG